MTILFFFFSFSPAPSPQHCSAAATANDGRPTIVDLFNMFHGALAAVTAHMRSAAVNSLGVLLFRFSRTPEIEALAPEILRTIVLLLREKVSVAALSLRVSCVLSSRS